MTLKHVSHGIGVGKFWVKCFTSPDIPHCHLCRKFSRRCRKRTTAIYSQCYINFRFDSSRAHTKREKNNIRLVRCVATTVTNSTQSGYRIENGPFERLPLGSLRGVYRLPVDILLTIEVKRYPLYTCSVRSPFSSGSLSSKKMLA